jgi:uncharacterized protein (TIGR03083 family)
MTAPAATRRRPAARRPAQDRDLAMRLAATEYERFTEVVQGLSGDDWAAATDCPAWSVRDIVGHVLGSMQMAASLREQLSQVMAARARGGDLTDALSAEQVHRCAGLTSDQVAASLAKAGRRAARGRRRLPAVVRRRPLPVPVTVGDTTERWTLGYLIDAVLTRDTWMHRIDVCRATGRAPHLTADHDGLITDDLVNEWADRHGQPYRLVLGGPAGGTWSRGTDGTELRLDAVEFARAISGRGRREGLLSVAVPF